MAIATPHPTTHSDPDGVAHAVVGLTALFSIMLAMVIVVLFSTGTTSGQVGAVVLGLTAVPVLVYCLQRLAARDRDRHTR
jgi:uncharacterized membrane protein YuzA (DUF378 family)